MKIILDWPEIRKILIDRVLKDFNFDASKATVNMGLNNEVTIAVEMPSEKKPMP